MAESKKSIKVRDLKPSKDAMGGGGKKKAASKGGGGGGNRKISKKNAQFEG